MKLSRRGIFGAAAGAAVSGPSIIKGAVTQGAAGLGSTRPEFPGVGMIDKYQQITPSENLRSLMLRRQNVASMGLNEHHADSLTGHCIDSLRSVSAVNKVRMRYESEIACSKKRELSWIDEQIKSVSGSLGPLAQLVNPKKTT